MTNSNSTDMTSSLLTYMMTIESLAGKSARVRSADIAEALGVARASVCKALDRLTDGGYALRCPEGVCLTEKGRRVTEIYAPARMMVEEALSERLGVPAARAERESVAVLGVLSEDTVVRIARMREGGKERN